MNIMNLLVRASPVATVGKMARVIVTGIVSTRRANGKICVHCGKENEDAISD